MEQMTFKKFVEHEEPLKRKVLIVGRIGNGRRLLRAYEKKTGNCVSAVSCTTLADLAKEIFFTAYEWNEQEDFALDGVSYVNDRVGSGYLRIVFARAQEELYYFSKVSEKMFEGNVMVEMYQALNHVRRNSLKEGKKKEELPEKLQDLFVLAERYEKALKESFQIDMTGIYQYLVKNLQAEDLFGISVEQIGLLKDGTEYSELEEKFLKRLSEKMKENVAGEDEIVTEVRVDGEDRKDKWSFLSGYGLYNEARAIVLDLLEKKHKFGEVEVLCQSDAQIQFFEAAFGEVGIPCSFLAKRTVVWNPVILKFLHILDFAKDDFSEKAFHRLYGFLPKSREYTVGWGFERNLEFCERKIKNTGEDRERSLEFWKKCREMLLCFEDSENPGKLVTEISVSELYPKILEWIRKDSTKTEENGKEKINGFYQMVKEDFAELATVFSYDEEKRSLSDVIRIIKRELKNLKKEEKEREDCVILSKFSGFFKSDREHLYVSGLSMQEFEGNQRESAFLSDAEITEYFGDQIPTLIKKNSKKIQDMEKMISAFEGDTITFSYSFFDTVESRKMAPAPFFRNLLGRAGISLEEVPKFVYGKEGLRNQKMADDAKDEQKSQGGKPCLSWFRCELKKGLRTSASGLENFVDCPKRYFYERVLRLPKEEFFEKDQDRWLPLNEKGNFCHRVLERYVNEIYLGSTPSGSGINKQVLEEKIKEVCEEMKTNVPSAVPALIEKEKEEMEQKCERYLTALDDELKSGDWKVLATEYEFHEIPYAVSTYEKIEDEYQADEDYEDGNRETVDETDVQENYNFNLEKGYIDRIDYRIKEEEKCISLRVIDYKSGRYDRKKTEMELGKTLQNVLYLHILHDEKIKEDLLEKIEKNEGHPLKGYQWKADEFRYDFPLEEDPEKFHLDVKDSYGLQRLRSILSVFEEEGRCTCLKEIVNDICGHVIKYSGGDYVDKASAPNFAQSVSELIGLQENFIKHAKELEGGCTYCAYKELCPNYQP